MEEQKAAKTKTGCATRPNHPAVEQGACADVAGCTWLPPCPRRRICTRRGRQPTRRPERLQLSPGARRARIRRRARRQPGVAAGCCAGSTSPACRRFERLGERKRCTGRAKLGTPATRRWLPAPSQAMLCLRWASNDQAPGTHTVLAPAGWLWLQLWQSVACWSLLWPRQFRFSLHASYYPCHSAAILAASYHLLCHSSILTSCHTSSCHRFSLSSPRHLIISPPPLSPLLTHLCHHRFVHLLCAMD